MANHLDEAERRSGKRKNGKTTKDVRTSDGHHNGQYTTRSQFKFWTELIRKRETILAESHESKIIGMYGLGMSLRDISKHIKDMFDTEISHSTISAITDKIIPEVMEWGQDHRMSFSPPFGWMLCTTK